MVWVLELDMEWDNVLVMEKDADLGNPSGNQSDRAWDMVWDDERAVAKDKERDGRWGSLKDSLLDTESAPKLGKGSVLGMGVSKAVAKVEELDKTLVRMREHLSGKGLDRELVEMLDGCWGKERDWVMVDLLEFLWDKG